MTRPDLSTRQLGILALVVVLVAGPVAGAVGSLTAPSLSNSVDVQGGVPLAAPDGPTVVLAGETSANLTNPFPSTDTVRVWSGIGNGTISGTGGELSVESFDDTATVTNISASGESVTLNPQQLRTYGVAGGIDSLTYRATTVDDDAWDFQYAAGSTAEVTVHGLTENVGYSFVASDGSVLDKALAGGDGTATGELPSGSYDVQLATTEFATPAISDVRPIGRINSLPDTVYANISDADFPDDTVNATAAIIQPDGDRRVIGTDTATSDGEVVDFALSQADREFIATGENTLEVVAEDEYGGQATVTEPFNVPANLTIHPVSDADSLVTNTSNVTFYSLPGNDTVFSTTVTDGTVNLSDYPVTTGFTVTVDAQGYFSRSLQLQSIYEQQRVYLLSENASSIEVRFELEDATGEWPSNSVLSINRPITRNNSTQYRTVVSDTFGVEGVTTDLEEGVRYQLEIRSPDGNTAALGSYTARVSETVTLRPEAPGVSIQAGDALAYDASVDGDTLTVEYRDPEDQTEELTVTVRERSSGDIVVPPQTFYDLGNLSLSEPIGNETGGLVVELTGSRAGNEIDIRITTGERPTDILPELGQMWRLAAGVFILLVSAGIFSQLNVGVGAVVLALEGGVLWWFGFLNGAATGASVALAICSAVVFNVATRR